MPKNIYRGKRLDNEKWVYGSYIDCQNAAVICWGQEFTDNAEFPVVPETVGQSTGMTEFIMADPSVKEELFEGDIVEVWSRRRMPCEAMDWTPKSQYDTVRKVRAVITFKNGEYKLDYNNDYNHAMERKQGTERYKKTVAAIGSLYAYGYHRENEDWFRERNSEDFWHDIRKLGNIFDNPELLNS